MTVHRGLRLFFLAFPLIAATAPSHGEPPEPVPVATAALTLPRAIDLALRNNPDMRAAEARIGASMARLREIRAAFMPQVYAGLSYTHSNDPARAFGMIVSQRRFSPGADINQPGYEEDFRPEVGVRWSLFRGGQDYYAQQAARLGVDAATIRKTALRNQLATAVSTAFYHLLEAPKRLEVAQRTLTTVSRELDFMEARRRQGMALKSDVLSLEVRLARAREQRIRAENLSESAKAVLRNLLALPAAEDIQIAPGETEPPTSAGEFPNWLEKAMEARPELRAANRQVAAREKELLAAKGARLPSVDAFLVYGQNSKDPGFSTDKDNLTVGVQARLDLFSGGAVSARIQQARQRLDEARAMAERTRLQVEQEVKQAWLNLREALARLEVARRQVEAADEALRLVRAQYRGGTATVTRFLEAETDRAAARLHWISARFNALIAQAELKRVTGLWFQQESPL